jgi:hypothetical protein
MRGLGLTAALVKSGKDAVVKVQGSTVASVRSSNNKISNFLKHADRDAGKSIEISTGDAILRITRVLVYYDELGLPRTNVMHVYAQGASWHHPNDESKRLPLHDGRHFHDMGLAWQISVGNRMLETILNADIQVD